MNDDQRKHLDMLQAVVTRLAGNSFTIKSWAITLISLLGGLAAKEANPWFAFLLLIPAGCFWGLDGYYLYQERLFRKLFQQAADPASHIPLFCMDTQILPVNERGSWSESVVAPAVLLVHCPISIFILCIVGFSILHCARA
jgi:hypothetical protein